MDDDEPIANRRASLTTPAKPKPPGELTDTFSKARKYIQSGTFMYSFWMAALRYLLYLNHALIPWAAAAGKKRKRARDGDDDSDAASSAPDEDEDDDDGEDSS